MFMRAKASATATSERQQRLFTTIGCQFHWLSISPITASDNYTVVTTASVGGPHCTVVSLGTLLYWAEIGKAILCFMSLFLKKQSIAGS